MALYLSNVKDELNSVIKKLRNLDHHYTETAFAITALEKVSNCSNWKGQMIMMTPTSGSQADTLRIVTVCRFMKGMGILMVSTYG